MLSIEVAKLPPQQLIVFYCWSYLHADSGWSKKEDTLTLSTLPLICMSPFKIKNHRACISKGWVQATKYWTSQMKIDYFLYTDWKGNICLEDGQNCLISKLGKFIPSKSNWNESYEDKRKVRYLPHNLRQLSL